MHGTEFKNPELAISLSNAQLAEEYGARPFKPYGKSYAEQKRHEKDKCNQRHKQIERALLYAVHEIEWAA